MHDAIGRALSRHGQSAELGAGARRWRFGMGVLARAKLLGVDTTTVGCPQAAGQATAPGAGGPG